MRSVYHQEQRKRMDSGFLLIDKPAGITSHDVIDELRKITGIRKIGHAGTLDPFATGLLIVAVGRQATREISALVGHDKTYEAEFVLGATSETLDPESEITADPEARPYTAEEITTTAESLTGALDQIPPMYSAIKKNGKKLYELARKGETIEREPRKVTIHTFELSSEPTQEDGLTIAPVHIRCSSGTYIRALARDLAHALKTTGHVRSLRRTAIADFSIADAQSLNALTSDNWQSFLRSPNEMNLKSKSD